MPGIKSYASPKTGDATASLADLLSALVVASKEHEAQSSGSEEALQEIRNQAEATSDVPFGRDSTVTGLTLKVLDSFPTEFLESFADEAHFTSIGKALDNDGRLLVDSLYGLVCSVKDIICDKYAPGEKGNFAILRNNKKISVEDMHEPLEAKNREMAELGFEPDVYTLKYVGEHPKIPTERIDFRRKKSTGLSFFRNFVRGERVYDYAGMQIITRDRSYHGSKPSKPQKAKEKQILDEVVTLLKESDLFNSYNFRKYFNHGSSSVQTIHQKVKDPREGTFYVNNGYINTPALEQELIKFNRERAVKEVMPPEGFDFACFYEDHYHGRLCYSAIGGNQIIDIGTHLELGLRDSAAGERRLKHFGDMVSKLAKDKYQQYMSDLESLLTYVPKTVKPKKKCEVDEKASDSQSAKGAVLSADWKLTRLHPSLIKFDPENVQSMDQDSPNTISVYSYKKESDAVAHLEHLEGYESISGYNRLVDDSVRSPKNEKHIVFRSGRTIVELVSAKENSYIAEKRLAKAVSRLSPSLDEVKNFRIKKDSDKLPIDVHVENIQAAYRFTRRYEPVLEFSEANEEAQVFDRYESPKVDAKTGDTYKDVQFIAKTNLGFLIELQFKDKHTYKSNETGSLCHSIYREKQIESFLANNPLYVDFVRMVSTGKGFEQFSGKISYVISKRAIQEAALSISTSRDFEKAAEVEVAKVVGSIASANKKNLEYSDKIDLDERLSLLPLKAVAYSHEAKSSKFMEHGLAVKNELEKHGVPTVDIDEIISYSLSQEVDSVIDGSADATNIHDLSKKTVARLDKLSGHLSLAKQLNPFGVYNVPHDQIALVPLSYAAQLAIQAKSSKTSLTELYDIISSEKSPFKDALESFREFSSAVHCLDLDETEIWSNVLIPYQDKAASTIRELLYSGKSRTASPYKQLLALAVYEDLIDVQSHQFYLDDYATEKEFVRNMPSEFVCDLDLDMLRPTSMPHKRIANFVDQYSSKYMERVVSKSGLDSSYVQKVESILQKFNS